MIVSADDLAVELRRRRVAKGLVGALDGRSDPTWVPAELAATPTSYLVLAAVALRDGRPRGVTPRPPNPA